MDSRGRNPYPGSRPERSPWCTDVFVQELHVSASRRILCLACAVGLVIVLAPASGATTGAAPRPKSDRADQIRQLVRDAMEQQHLKTVIVSVTVDGKRVLTEAFGDSLPGVPATTAMHFRNGAVAFAYIGNLLMQFVDEGKVDLDDTIDRWLPDLPDSDTVTLRMLANQTAGYPDFEQDPAWIAAYYADPFHTWTFAERLQYVTARPRPFAPGANWSYSHSNFMILGEVLAKIGGQPLATLLQRKVLGPLGLRNTVESETSAIPPPVLHTFSSERRGYYDIPPATPFYEDETSWNTQWGTPMGANETTTIADMVETAVAIGSGKLLSKSSYEAMTAPSLLGFGARDPACAPECFPQTAAYNFGLGVVRSGSWIKQNPALAGSASVEAYLPSKRIAIAIVNTFDQAFYEDPDPSLPSNPANELFQKIGALLAPHDAPIPLS
jgi:CubicO group peptidase (beta-lactamase class C family)